MEVAFIKYVPLFIASHGYETLLFSKYVNTYLS